MPSLSSVVVLGLLAPLALAAPTTKPEPVEKQSFTVPRVKRTNFVRNGKNELLRTYQKFSWPLPPWAYWGGEGGDSGFGSGSGSGSGFGSGSGSGSGFGGFGGSSSAAPFPFPASSAAPFPFPQSSFAPFPESSAAPFPESSAAPFPESSAAPFPQSSAAPVPASSAAPVPASSAAPSASAAPSGGASSAAKGVTGETAANSVEGGSEYISPVTVGTTKLNLDFDTGSADLWVYGSGVGGSGHTTFSQSSAGFKLKSGYSFQIQYGDGSSASGVVGTDKVAIGAATVTSQAVEVATQVSSSFSQDDSSDGLLGLAFSTINSVEPQQQKTFIANIQDQLASPLFTVYLDENGEGEYEFGAIDNSKYTGDITYTPCDNSEGYWGFTSTSYQINGKTSQNSRASPSIVDTGTSLVLVDAAVVDAYWGQVSSAQNSNEQGGYVYDCSATLPSFGVAIGTTGKYATIPGSAIKYAEVGDGTCFGGIQSNAGQGLQIFGDVFIRSQFVVFNPSVPQIGVATKA